MTPSPQTHEYHAEQVIKALRGYVIRQAWIIEDRAVVASILKEWHDEVAELEAKVARLEQEKAAGESSFIEAGSAIGPGYLFASHS